MAGEPVKIIRTNDPNVSEPALEIIQGDDAPALKIRQSNPNADTLQIVDGTITRVKIAFDGKVAFGDSLNDARLANPTSQRAVSLIDTNGNIRVWRWQAQAGSFNPAVELIQGNADDNPSGATNRWMDLYLDGAAAGTARLVLRDRSQVAGGNIDLIAAQMPSADNECGMWLLRQAPGGVRTIQRVTQGAADSGGAGFRALRIPN